MKKHRWTERITADWDSITNSNTDGPYIDDLTLDRAYKLAIIRLVEILSRNDDAPTETRS